VCWGRGGDAGTALTNWANVDVVGPWLGAFTHAASNLLAGQACTYRCFVTNANGGTWSAPIAFTTQVAQVSIDDVVVIEGHSGVTAAVFTVTLSNVSGPAVTLAFATSDGTATAGTDYLATNGMLTFLSGQVVQQIAVQVLGDTTPEATETFLVQLSNATNAAFVKDAGVGSIRTDEHGAVTPAGRVISVNFCDSGLTLDAGSVAGHVAVSNWNNVVDTTTNFNLFDSAGRATPCWLRAESGSYLYRNATPAYDGHALMMATFRDALGPDPRSIRCGDIPWKVYDVVVYWGGGSTNYGMPQSIAIALPGASRAMRDTNGQWEEVYAESRATTAGAAVDGENYVVFRNQSEPSLEISYNGSIARVGPSGLQLVEIPQPLSGAILVVR
jgi:hypothetical protein